MSYVATGEVTTLEHELGDDTVELAARVAEALLASAQGTEVLSGLGDNIIEELEVDAARAGWMGEGVSEMDDEVKRIEWLSSRTLVALVGRGDLAIGIGLQLRTSPGHVEVGSIGGVRVSLAG